VPDNTDCDDLHAEVNLYAGEICDGLDNNCNGYVDEWVAVENFLDADGDGYGDPGSVILSCSPIEGRILRGGDCDDADPSIHPGATELLNDRDDDCDGAVDEDFPAQRIRFIRDVPNDQGRAVRLRWRRHMNEILPNYLQGPAFVATYIVFRRVEPGQAQAMRARPEGHQPQSLPPGEWDIVATVPAMNDSAYQVVVPTLCDSNSTGFCRSTFFVRAQWEESYGVFFEDSAPDSGYSVDNIAPGVPQGFLASAQRSGNQLSWTAELPEDFQYFRLYRSTDPGFTPGPATLLRSTIDSHWLDPAGGAFTYKLTSVDANGNESEAAVASTTLGVSGRPLATTLSFSTLGPNPFRSTLALSFDVPRDRIDVTLTVHDLAGRRVRTLARGSYAAGRNSVTWDGRADDGRPLHAGVYLLRLTGDGRSATRQVTYVP
jgi:hypothetical protein